MTSATRTARRLLAGLSRRQCAIAALGALAAMSVSAAASCAAPRADSPSTCEAVSLPVTLAPGQAAKYQISGTLCGVDPAAANQTIELLVPGLTYTREYWQFPYDPSRYSYVRYANAAGLATLAIDRI